MPLGGRSYELIATEARGPDTEAQSCGIGADASRTAGIRSSEYKVNRGTWETVEKNADGTPMKIPGIYLTLQQQKTTSH